MSALIDGYLTHVHSKLQMALEDRRAAILSRYTVEDHLTNALIAPVITSFLEAIDAQVAPLCQDMRTILSISALAIPDSQASGLALR